MTYDIYRANPVCLLSPYNYKIEASIGLNRTVQSNYLTVLDTGAGPNLIRSDCLDAEALAMVDDSQNIVNLASATQHRLDTLGIVTLTVTVAGYTSRQQFVVVKELGTDAILGCTFIDCRRGRTESLSSFVSRFRGLAADHLLNLGLSASSQVSEILAITLLNNANLSDETLTNAKLQLIPLAQAREEETSQASASITNATLKKLEDVCALLAKFPREVPMRVYRSDTPRALKLKILTSRRQIEIFSESLQGAIDEIRIVQAKQSSVGELLLKATPRCRLNLDDAVTVIRNLSFNSQSDNQMYTKADIDNIVGQKVQSAMFALSKERGYNIQGSEGTKQGSSRQNRSDYRKGSGTKRSSSDSFCYDCGDPNHLSGSLECKSPSYLTKKRRTERSGAERKKQTSSNQEKKVHFQENNNRQDNESIFREGSNPMKRNHA